MYARDVSNATATIVPVFPIPATNRCQTLEAPAYDGTTVVDEQCTMARYRDRCQCGRGPTAGDKEATNSASENLSARDDVYGLSKAHSIRGVM